MRRTDKQIADALRKTLGYRTHAAKLLEVCYQTVTNRINSSEYLQKVAEEIEESDLDLAESKLKENVTSGKESSIFYFLNNKGRVRGYGKERVEISGPNGGPIEVSFKNRLASIVNDIPDSVLDD